AHGRHGRAAVRLEDVAHDANRVREVRVRRDHRLDPGLPGGTMSEFTPARPANRTHLADAEWREVVVEHVRLPRLSFELLDSLLVALRAECRDRQRLGFAA